MTDTRIQAINLLYTGMFKIKDKSGKSVRFHPNGIQKKILDKIKADWKADRKSFIIAVKGRQFGISTLIKLLDLALTITTQGWQSYTMTHRLDLAKDLFDNKIKYAFDYLPEEFKKLLGADKNNARQLVFTNIDKSSITVGTSGRGGTYQSLHISESGMMSTLPEVWHEMINGTLEAGSQADLVIHESTADGGLGLFYEYVQANLDKVMFISWLDHFEYTTTPPEDNTWTLEYNQLAKDYDLERNPLELMTKGQWYWYYIKTKSLKDQVKIQYPLSLEEAFQAYSDNYFNSEILKRYLEKAKTAKRETVSDFTIFKHPIPGRRYVVGVDTSSGESKDNTSINVFDCTTLEQVACCTGSYSEEITARMSIVIANRYNQAVIAVEINNMGRAVQSFIERFEYPDDKIYKRYEVDSTNPRLTRIAKHGWLTSSATRPIMLSEFKSSFENYHLIINDVETLKEMTTFVNIKGKYQAQLGKQDDRVMSCMIAFQAIKYVFDYC